MQLDQIKKLRIADEFCIVHRAMVDDCISRAREEADKWYYDKLERAEFESDSREKTFRSSSSMYHRDQKEADSE